MTFVFPRRPNILCDLFTFEAQHDADTEQVSSGNLTQNSNVALVNSPTVVFNNIVIQLLCYDSKCRK